MLQIASSAQLSGGERLAQALRGGGQLRIQAAAPLKPAIGQMSRPDAIRVWRVAACRQGPLGTWFVETQVKILEEPNRTCISVWIHTG